jgi:VIT1/CCC1 family predicted Fe2+/Mn2+ transporter
VLNTIDGVPNAINGVNVNCPAPSLTILPNPSRASRVRNSAICSQRSKTVQFSDTALLRVSASSLAISALCTRSSYSNITRFVDDSDEGDDDDDASDSACNSRSALSARLLVSFNSFFSASFSVYVSVNNVDSCRFVLAFAVVVAFTGVFAIVSTVSCGEADMGLMIMMMQGGKGKGRQR